MSFLFKSKSKNAPPQQQQQQQQQTSPSGLPAASRNIHTSDGTTGPAKPPLAGSFDDRKTQSPPPNISANGSLNSLADQKPTAPPSQPSQMAPNGPQAPFARRDRAASELGTRPPQQQMRPPPHADLYPWSQKPLAFPNPQANPFPRYGAAVNSIASKEGDVYLMGGLINGETVRGDLWMVEAGSQQLSCYPIATVSEGPGPRVGHASLLVGNAFIVFGGDTQQEDTDVLDDTLYLLNTTSRQWSRASPPGTRPAGRYGHTLNILGSRIYIFGGQVEGSFYNDLIAFDLNALQNPNNQWEFLISNTDGEKSLDVPPARTNHTMISHNDSLLLFGGTDGHQWFNDVWIYDPKANKWTQQDCIGYIPAPREGHSAALVNDVMYIFGGRTEHGDDLGDLAAFRISLRRWYTFQNMGPSPSPRSGHSMTAFGKQIVVLAGEPSTAPRDSAELSMAYVLDTAKIRYPNDAPTTQSKQGNPTSPTRQTSDAARNMVAARSVSREGPVPRGESPKDSGMINGGPVQRPDAQQSRLPRASMGPGPTGPPPQSQAPNPRQNGMAQPDAASRGPPGHMMNYSGMRQPGPGPGQSRQMPPPGPEQPRQMHPPGPEQSRQLPSELPEQPTQLPPKAPTPTQYPPTRNDSREGARPSNREQSPGSHGRRTPQTPSSKAKAMEAGEAAPLVGPAVARQRSQRSQRTHSSIDGSEEGILRSSSARSHAEHRHSKSFAEEPHSPNISPHHEALMRELDSLKSKNAWYASELALAKKSGYTAGSSPTMDERATMNFADDDRPLMEAFMTMRNELMKMQQNMEQQSKMTGQKIAEVEHQRDAAVTEAAYARAKLAAHGGSQRSTPQMDSSRDGDDAERSTDISRRLALSLAAANEHKARLEAITSELENERRAREAAEEAAEAAQNRFDDLSNSRNPGEVEALKAELHDTQSFARAEAGRRADLEQKLRMLEVDHKDLQEKHGDMSNQVSGHISSLAALEAAIAASNSKASMFERQLDEERQNRDELEQKLSQLRAQHEERTQELESTTRRLRDAEELAETHAKEANTHREALMAGLAKISRPDSALARDTSSDERIQALQEVAEEARRLAKANEDAAEAAAQKLRGAEERIAGLEAYQEQSSREGLSIRRQLQTALRDVRNHETENRDLRSQVETHQRDASALTVQHSALKDLLGERGVDMSTNRRSPGFDNGSRNGTPDLARSRELEQQLQASHRAHDETKSMFEAREQEAEKAYRERLEQLENDYQSLLTYVKGTEKMLKKMKEELTKYKSVNQRLSSELEASRDGMRSVSSTNTDATEWANERDAMSSAISEMKAQMANQISTLEANMASVKQDLEKAQAERDEQKASHDELSRSIDKREQELAELKSENGMLETRALDAEHRVTMLLDQVGSSVNNYRRASQMQPIPPNATTNGVPTATNQNANPNLNRAISPSTATDTSSQAGDHDDGRGSLALDNLASELETLKAQWESQSRSYRLSDRFDFERTPTRESHGAAGGNELSESLAKWRNEEDRTPTVERMQGAHQNEGGSGLSSGSAVAAQAAMERK
ncbi:Negative regulator of mitotic exit [Knufia obscura]|uniref:Negative regulator of mitotic exit n=2 Tax=Knufia TaxID=430999 RepID=A0AAN8EEU1_9EURO|nr:Negative regulator of mitotic exit [Knufia obscura]KAK5949032.1 Negative regulator of mitotic exit [Knufia fluminis]